MKITKRNRKGFTLVELLVVMAIIAVLASIATPLVISRIKDADKTKATLHAKQIYIAITDFRREYGSYPGEGTVSDIDGSSASTSNDICRMLMQGLPNVRSESIFFAPSKLSKKPDGDTGEAPNFPKACQKGEVGFGYVDSPDAKDAAPLFFAPLATADGKRFDYEAYNGYAIVMNREGTVEALQIDEQSELVMVKSGGSKVNLLSSANTKFRSAPKILPVDPK